MLCLALLNFYLHVHNFEIAPMLLLTISFSITSLIFSLRWLLSTITFQDCVFMSFIFLPIPSLECKISYGRQEIKITTCYVICVWDESQALNDQSLTERSEVTVHLSQHASDITQWCVEWRASREEFAFYAITNV